jgi:hypothetical protein
MTAVCVNSVFQVSCTCASPPLATGDALITVDVDERHIHSDKAAGAKDHRLGLKACLGCLQAGGGLVGWKLDALGPPRQTPPSSSHRSQAYVRARYMYRPHIVNIGEAVALTDHEDVQRNIQVRSMQFPKPMTDGANAK